MVLAVLQVQVVQVVHLELQVQVELLVHQVQVKHLELQVLQDLTVQVVQQVYQANQH